MPIINTTIGKIIICLFALTKSPDTFKISVANCTLLLKINADIIASIPIRNRIMLITRNISGYEFLESVF